MTAPDLEGRRAASRTARDLALDVLVRWDRPRAPFLDRLLRRALDGCLLDSRDRRLATDLACGCVRHWNTLEAVAARHVRRPLERVDGDVRVALFLGIYQAIYLGTPGHAVVHESVEALAARCRDHEGGDARAERVGSFLNAVLRKVCDAVEPLDPGVAAEDDDDAVWGRDRWVRIPGLALPRRDEHLAARLAIQYSHPQELVRIWLARLGEEALLPILRHDNAPPRVFIVLPDRSASQRVPDALRAAGATLRDTEVPGCWEVRRAGSVESLPGFSAGRFWVQDRTARRLSLALSPCAGGSLLDLCAAPGGKLLGLLDRDAPREAVACDVSAEKIERLAENLNRLGWASPPVRLLQVPEDPRTIRFDRHFDRVLVDVPCSNTGVLNRRHEARWRLNPESLRELRQVQVSLLRAGARHLAPGGELLYNTCSIEPSENGEVVEDLIRGETELQLVEEIEVLPGEGGGDGGYAARIRRRAGR